MAALLTFLVVCSVSALVVAIYAANRGDKFDSSEWWHWRSRIGDSPDTWDIDWIRARRNPLSERVYDIERQLKPALKTPQPDPTLADRLAALEAKRGKK